MDFIVENKITENLERREPILDLRDQLLLVPAAVMSRSIKRKTLANLPNSPVQQLDAHSAAVFALLD